MTDRVPLDALAAAVARAFPHARIAHHEALAGDASSRRYVRLTLEDAPTSTVVAMLLGEGRFSPAGDELGSGPVTELPFVDVGRWAHGVGLPVAHVVFDGSREWGLLLVEDVGDTSLWTTLTAHPADVDHWLTAALDLLVAWQTAGIRTPDPTSIAFRRRFDADLARAELAHFVDHGIETRHGRSLEPAARHDILEALAPLVAPFGNEAPWLVHRDYMAWNLQVHAGALRIIDYQDAFLGPETYDVAALLTDRSMPSLVDDARAERLLAHYATTRARAGLPVTIDLASEYRACVLHRALKVIGRFWFLERVKGKPGYLAYLPGVYAVARAAFAAMPALRPARDLVLPWVPELAA